MVGGSSLAYIFPIITAPILTRIYNPLEFKLFAIYIAIVQIAAISFSLKYELEIPLAKIRSNRINLFVLSILNTIFTIFFFSVLSVIFIFIYPINQFNGIFIFLPFGIFLQTTFNHIIYNWLLYKKNFKLISFGKIIFISIYSFLPIIFFYFLTLKNYKYIILSHQIGLIFAIAYISFSIYSNRLFEIIKLIFSTKLFNLKTTFFRYKKYALYSMPSHLLNSFGLWLPTFFIWFYFDEKYIALFFLSHRIINTPVLLIGQSIGKIFYSEASTKIKKNKLNISVINYYKILIHIALPFLFICIFLIDEIFLILFNSDWSDIINIIKLFSPWLFIVFIASPLSTIPTILYQQENEFNFQLKLMIVRIISLCGGVYLDDIFLMFSFYSLGNFIVWFFYLLKIFTMVGINKKIIVKNTFQSILEHFFIIVFILLINFINIDGIYILMLTLFIIIFVLYSFYGRLKNIKF